MSRGSTEKLVIVIETRSNMLLNDSRTFIAAKTMSPKTVKLAKSSEIGGGNLLVALGMMSLLEFLARIYWMIEMSTSDLNKYTEKQGLKSINAVDAVSKLISDLEKNAIDLGITTDIATIREVWNNYRNELAHYLWIHNGGSASKPPEYIPSKSLSDIEKDWLEKTVFKKPFEKVFYPQENNKLDSRYILSADRLRFEVPKIIKWLVDKIKAVPEEKSDEVLRVINLGYR